MNHFNFQTHPNTESCSLLPLSYLPTLSNSPYLQIIFHRDQLLQEVAAIRGEVFALRAELQTLKEQQKAYLASAGQCQSANGSKSKKIFKKDKNCPIEGCNRKYSSRIAVNAHLRKFHGRRVHRE